MPRVRSRGSVLVGPAGAALATRAIAARHGLGDSEALTPSARPAGAPEPEPEPEPEPQTQQRQDTQGLFKAAASAARETKKLESVLNRLASESAPVRRNRARFGEQAGRAVKWNGGREPLARTTIQTSLDSRTTTCYLSRNFTEAPTVDVEIDDGDLNASLPLLKGSDDAPTATNLVPTAFAVPDGLPKELVCPICTDAVIEPVVDEVYGAGRTTCRECLTLREGNAYAASCRPDTVATERLMSGEFPVICRYAWVVEGGLITADTSGCRAKFAMKDRRAHESKCQFRTVRCNLPHSSNPAENCQERLRLSQIDAHRKDCSHNVERCQNEGCGRMIQRRRAEAHERLCDYKIIRCSQSTRQNPCPWTGCQMDLEEHLHNDCLRVMTTCNCQDVEGPDRHGAESLFLQHRKRVIESSRYADEDGGSMINIDALYSIEPPEESKRCPITKLRADIEEHRRTECPYRIVSCSFCSAKLSFKNLHHHERLCNSRYYKCNACMRPVHRHRREKHILTNCPAAEVECMFGSVGCEARVLRADYQEHMIEGVARHIELLCTNEISGIEFLSGQALAMHAVLIRVREASAGSTMDLQATCRQWWSEVEDWREFDVLRTIDGIREELAQIEAMQRANVERLRIEAERVADKTDEKTLRMYAASQRMKEYIKEQQSADTFARGDFFEAAREELRMHSKNIANAFQRSVANSRHKLEAGIRAIESTSRKGHDWRDHYARRITATERVLDEVKERRIGAIAALFERLHTARTSFNAAMNRQQVAHDHMDHRISALLEPDGTNTSPYPRARHDADTVADPESEAQTTINTLQSYEIGADGVPAQRHLLELYLDSLDEHARHVADRAAALEADERKTTEAQNKLLDEMANSDARKVVIAHYNNSIVQVRKQLTEAREDLRATAKRQQTLMLAMNRSELAGNKKHVHESLEEEQTVALSKDSAFSALEVAATAKALAERRQENATARCAEWTSNVLTAIEEGRRIVSEIDRFYPILATRARIVSLLNEMAAFDGSIGSIIEDIHAGIRRAKTALGNTEALPSIEERPSSPSLWLARAAATAFAHLLHDCSGYQSEAISHYLRSREALREYIQRIDDFGEQVRSIERVCWSAHAELVQAHNSHALEGARTDLDDAQEQVRLAQNDVAAAEGALVSYKRLHDEKVQAYKNCELEVLGVRQNLENNIKKVVEGAQKHLQACEGEVERREEEVLAERIRDIAHFGLERAMLTEQGGNLNLGAPVGSGIHAPHMREYHKMVAELRMARNAVVEAKENLGKALQNQDDCTKSLQRQEERRDRLKVEYETAERASLDASPQSIEQAEQVYEARVVSENEKRALFHRLESILGRIDGGESDGEIVHDAETLGLMLKIDRHHLIRRMSVAAGENSDDGNTPHGVVHSASLGAGDAISKIEEFSAAARARLNLDRPDLASPQELESVIMLEALRPCVNSDEFDGARQESIVRTVMAYNELSQNIQKWRSLRHLLSERTNAVESEHFAAAEEQALMLEHGGTSLEVDVDTSSTIDAGNPSSGVSAMNESDSFPHIAEFASGREGDTPSEIVRDLESSCDNLFELMGMMRSQASEYVVALQNLFGRAPDERVQSTSDEQLDETLVTVTGMRVMHVIGASSDDESSPDDEKTLHALLERMHSYGGDLALQRFESECNPINNEPYMRAYHACKAEVRTKTQRVRAAQARLKACKDSKECIAGPADKRAGLCAIAYADAEELLRREESDLQAATLVMREARRRLESACTRFLAAEYENPSNLTQLLERIAQEIRDAESAVDSAKELADAIAQQLEACQHALAKALEEGSDASAIHEHEYQLDKRLYAAKRALDGVHNRRDALRAREKELEAARESLATAESTRRALATKAWETALSAAAEMGAVREAELRLRVEGAKCTSDNDVLEIFEGLSAAVHAAAGCGVDVLHAREDAKRGGPEFLLRIRVLGDGTAADAPFPVPNASWYAAFRAHLAAGYHVKVLEEPGTISWPAGEWEIVREVASIASRSRIDLLDAARTSIQLEQARPSGLHPLGHMLSVAYVQEMNERVDVLAAQRRQASDRVESAKFDYQSARFAAHRQRWARKSGDGTSAETQQMHIGAAEFARLQQAQAFCDTLSERASAARDEAQRVGQLVGGGILSTLRSL